MGKRARDYGGRRGRKGERRERQGGTENKYMHVYIKREQTRIYIRTCTQTC